MMGERLLPVAVGQARNDMAGQQPEVCILQRDRALDQLAQGPDDRIKPLAAERQVGELPVDLDRAPQIGVLGVDDPLEDRGHDLEVGHVLGDPNQGDAELVGLAEHAARDLR